LKTAEHSMQGPIRRVQFLVAEQSKQQTVYSFCIRLYQSIMRARVRTLNNYMIKPYENFRKFSKRTIDYW